MGAELNSDIRETSASNITTNIFQKQNNLLLYNSAVKQIV